MFLVESDVFEESEVEEEEMDTEDRRDDFLSGTRGRGLAEPEPVLHGDSLLTPEPQADWPAAGPEPHGDWFLG